MCLIGALGDEHVIFVVSMCPMFRIHYVMTSMAMTVLFRYKFIYLSLIDQY